MQKLIRLIAMLALMLAPLAVVAPVAARPALVMADCHDAAPAPAKSDCCSESGAHACCPAALAVLPVTVLPLPGRFAYAEWPALTMRASALAPGPIDQPPRA